MPPSCNAEEKKEGNEKVKRGKKKEQLSHSISCQQPVAYLDCLQRQVFSRAPVRRPLRTKVIASAFQRLLRKKRTVSTFH
jgi:hypothetical protein